MTAREQILGDIRRALGRTPVSVMRAPEGDLQAPALRIPQMDRKLATSLFVQSFEKLVGKAMVVRDSASVVPQLQELLQGRNAVASNAPFLDACGVTRLAGVQSGFENRDALRQACATAGVGITSVDYALAETGSFAMLSSRQEARMVSLLPPVHVAVFPRSRILANLDQLLRILPKPAEQTSSMVLITGPSRTADIEQILIRGVHGPGEVYAVIVEEE
jgi:L-lactate dehydrogenase complex protein LldG